MSTPLPGPPRKASVDAADFYVGRGPEGDYLGTAYSFDGSPERIAAFESFQSLDAEEYTEDTFRTVVADLLGENEGPNVWPWPYRTSEPTPWTYMFDKGTVYIYRYGVELAVLRCNYSRATPPGAIEAGKPARTPREVAPRMFPLVGRLGPAFVTR